MLARAARRLWEWMRGIRLDYGGIVFGVMGVVLSITPSLVPRPAVLQGVVSGVSFGLAYALGALVLRIARRVVRWRPTPGGMRVAWLALAAAVAVTTVVMAFVAVGWQNEVRRLVDMPPLDAADVGGFLVAAVAMGCVALGIGRGIRALNRRFTRTATKRELRPAPLLAGVATAAVVALTVGAFGGLVLFAVDRIYADRNSAVQDDLAVPSSEFRSAGEDSAVEWAKLGRHGRTFVGGGPSASEIEELTGAPALTPIRVYVGMAEAATLEERAELAVAELERTGAFDRRVLVVATTTGSGWLEDQSMDALEYLQSGDTAIVSMQYAYTPSWVSFLTDQDLPVAASEALFTAVHEAWAALPENDRPALIAYGLSLGAHGMQSVFTSLDDVRDRTDGALFVGSPGSTALWNELQDARESGSPAWQPVLDDGREVRWLSNRGDFETLDGEWEHPRVAYLQHATDAVTWLTPELLWRSPEWLEPGQRGADVSPSMRWIPVVTGLQVLVDMLMGEAVPASHGHNFGDVVLEGWQAVTPEVTLSDAALDRIQSLIETYALDDSPVTD